MAWALLRCDCKTTERGTGSGIVTSDQTGASCAFEFRCCEDCIERLVLNYVRTEDSITRVPRKTVKHLNRCFEANVQQS